jgi:hypothetical protein
MDKVALAQVLSEVPKTLRAQQEKIAALTEENEKLKREQRAASVVDLAESKDVNLGGGSRKEKVAMLLDSGRDLGVMEAALNMQAPGSSFLKIAEDSSVSEGDHESALENLIVFG